MLIDKLSGLSRTMLVLGLALGSAGAMAEPDVLERPALMLSSQRLANAALIQVTTAGKRFVAVGERGVILWSDDQGARWSQAKVPVTVTMTDIHFADANQGWAVGHSGIVLGTKDGGQTWSKLLDGKQLAQIVQEEAKLPNASDAMKANAERLVADGPDKPLLSVHFCDPNNGWVVGAYGLILRTNNGGATWTSMAGQINNPKGAHLYAIQQTEQSFYIFGEQGSIFISKNGGGTFQAVKTPYAGTFFGGLRVDRQLLAYGMRGNVYWSDDDGKSWQKSGIPTSNTLTAGLRLSKGEVVLVDDAGGVYVSHDQGRNFASLGASKRIPLTGIAEASEGNIILASIRGISRASLVPAAPESKK